MKKYNCNRCNNYCTDCRNAFWQHQNKTKKCGKKKESTKKDTESIQNPPISFQLFSRTCKYCNKVFSTNSNMNKHMKRSCKIRKQQQQQEVATPQIINNYITNNNTNNNTIDNSQHITNNININAFGHENIAHLKNIILQCLLESNYAESMKKLTQFVYNDPKHPENHTVDMRNDRTKYAKIADGKGGFEERIKKDIVLLVINKNSVRFDRCMEENPHTHFTCGGLNHLNSYRDTKQEKKELFDEVQCVLINRSMPREEEEEE